MSYEMIFHECQQIKDKNLLRSTNENVIYKKYFGINYVDPLNRIWALTTPQTAFVEPINHCPYCGQLLDKNLTLESN